MTSETISVNHDQRVQILNQIGKVNVLAISGGRANAITDGIELPVGSGYRVWVRLLSNDTYRVERVFIRGGKVFEKGSVENIYCDDVGEVAYYASCFRNDSGVWTYGKPQVDEC